MDDSGNLLDVITTEETVEFSTGDTGNDDRLSVLPDEILCQILSLISTKDAVATSVLSTRWKYLFMSVPAIVFDDTLHPQASELEVNRFVGFVNKVLLQRNVSDLAKFHLRWDNARDISEINEWICAALCRRVQDLKVWVQWPKPLAQPVSSKVFECKSLVTLKLHGFIMHVPEVVSFPNLEVLNLEMIIFSGGDTCFRRVLDGCPSLKDLRLSKTVLLQIKILDLTSPTLKILSLVSCPGSFSVIIDNPTLVHLNLKISAIFKKQLIVKNLKSLTEAHLGAFHFKSVPSLSKFLNDFYNVKVLSLAGILAPEPLDYQMPMFQKLTNLEVVPYSPCALKTWLDIIDRAPYLVTLCLHMKNIGHFRDLIVKYLRPIESKFDKLMEVEVVDCHGLEHEMYLVEYLLQLGASLKVLKFTFSNKKMSAKDWPDSTMKRLAVWRRSSTCQILLP